MGMFYLFAIALCELLALGFQYRKKWAWYTSIIFFISYLKISILVAILGISSVLAKSTREDFSIGKEINEHYIPEKKKIFINYLFAFTLFILLITSTFILYALGKGRLW